MFEFCGPISLSHNSLPGTAPLKKGSLVVRWNGEFGGNSWCSVSEASSTGLTEFTIVLLKYPSKSSAHTAVLTVKSVMMKSICPFGLVNTLSGGANDGVNGGCTPVFGVKAPEIC
jgi:hypothetical protein